jgi:hypothetical protein
MRKLPRLNRSFAAIAASVGLTAFACSSGNPDGGFGTGDQTGSNAMGASDSAVGSDASSNSPSPAGSSGGGSSSGGKANGASSGSGSGGSGGATSDASKDSSLGTPDANAVRDSSSTIDSGSVVPSGDGGALDALRQKCVDTINMYRATLNLTPLKRATPAQEACSDMGAMHDATTMMAHGSANMCPGFPGYQDSCPDLPVGGFSGATLQSSLLQCLAQMWAEGPPPGTVQACEMDLTGCFQMHGHYINMSNPSLKTVSCGFYQMSNGDYWGNQDFAP